MELPSSEMGKAAEMWFFWWVGTLIMHLGKPDGTRLPSGFLGMQGLQAKPDSTTGSHPWPLYPQKQAP